MDLPLFCRPSHPWERGSDEKLNGPVRQYLPKGGYMRKGPKVYLDRIAEESDSRPRQRHGFPILMDVFHAD